MTIPDIITSSIAACAFLITLMLLVGAILGGNLKEKVYRWFFVMLLFNLVGCFSEFILPFLYGTPGKATAILIHVADFINYTCASLIYIGFAWYLYEFLSMKKDVPKHPFIIASVVSFVNIPLIAVAHFIPIFAWLDEYNNIHFKDTVWILSALFMLSTIVFIVIILRYVPILKQRVWVSLLLYMLMPFLCYIIELLFPGVWLGYLSGTLVMFLIHINIQVELNREIKEKELEMVESRIAIMLSQIQPHFLHNSLISIQYLCKHDAELAATAVSEFSRYLRGNMSALTNKAPITFEKELEHLRVYLSLEEKRFGERLQVEFDIQAGGFFLPALTIQPIVENAIQYGVTKRVEGGKVFVRSREENGCWRVIVEDNGVGFEPEKPKEDGKAHIGISNVRYRLDAMCGGTLDIESTPGIGTTATITIPKGAFRT